MTPHDPIPDVCARALMRSAQESASRLHLAGVGGSGMSALAQFLAMGGSPVSGSDRDFDRGRFLPRRDQLTELGVACHPQDGSGIGADCAALVVSTAVEETVPDVAAARRAGVPILHRSELLAHLAASFRTVAVTGTSGKSTTTALIFELLKGAGRDPSLLTGGELISLQAQGHWGNAWRGASDLLVMEADESDGSVVRYAPEVGVALNLQKDHKEPEQVMEYFRVFRQRTTGAFVVGEQAELRGLPDTITFGFGEGVDVRGEQIHLAPDHATFTVHGLPFRLPLTGRHNVENALAALAVCVALGVPLTELAEPLAKVQGVARRFQVLGTRRGVTVVDDFGHNPAKVAASIRAAHLRAPRVWAIFQPHGFGPLRFLRKEFVEAFATEVRPEDRLTFLEIYDQGGTATRDIRSADLVADLAARDVPADLAPDRGELVLRIAREAQAGDLVLLMGARDPSLSELAQSIFLGL